MLSLFAVAATQLAARRGSNNGKGNLSRSCRNAGRIARRNKKVSAAGLRHLRERNSLSGPEVPQLWRNLEDEKQARRGHQVRPEVHACFQPQAAREDKALRPIIGG